MNTFTKPSPPIYGAQSQYIEEPSELERENGVVPLDTLPAQWWNFLWNNITDYCDAANVEIKNIVTELSNVLAAANMTPDNTTPNQLLLAINIIKRELATTSTAGAVKSSNTNGKVSVDANGIMTANGLGNIADLTTSIKISVVAAINSLVTKTDTTNTNLSTTNTNIGTLSSLTTSVKTSIVNAINSLVTKTDTTNTNIGTLSSLTTSVKTSIVNAINSLVTKTDTTNTNLSTTNTNIGTLTDLTTSVKTSIVNAINSLVTKTDTTNTNLSTTNTNIGTLTDLTTSVKTSIVNAINSLVIDKMDKTNPSGTGAFSLNRKANTTIGAKSFAEGNNGTASGPYSHVEGADCTASGSHSHAEGFNCTASGADGSHAEGKYCKAKANYAHAEGYETEARSNAQHVQGKYNVIDANNTYADIVGGGTTSSARKNIEATDWNGNKYLKGDIYVGCNDDSSGGTALGAGLSTTNTNIGTLTDLTTSVKTSIVNAINSLVTSLGTTNTNIGTLTDLTTSVKTSIVAAINSLVTSLGTTNSNKMDKTNPTGTGAFSLNRKASTTVGNYSATEGNSCTASGSYSHAEGNACTASNAGAHAEGHSCTASGSYSHAEGNSCTASGSYSHAEGNSCTASGSYSHAEGNSCTARSSQQHVQGKYNVVDSGNTYADIVGGGTSTSARKNIEATDWNGNKRLKGDVFVNCADNSTGGIALGARALRHRDISATIDRIGGGSAPQVLLENVTVTGRIFTTPLIKDDGTYEGIFINGGSIYINWKSASAEGGSGGYGCVGLLVTADANGSLDFSSVPLTTVGEFGPSSGIVARQSRATSASAAKGNVFTALQNYLYTDNGTAWLQAKGFDIGAAAGPSSLLYITIEFYNMTNTPTCSGGSVGLYSVGSVPSSMRPIEVMSNGVAASQYHRIWSLPTGVLTLHK